MKAHFALANMGKELHHKNIVPKISRVIPKNLLTRTQLLLEFRQQLPNIGNLVPKIEIKGKHVDIVKMLPSLRALIEL